MRCGPPLSCLLLLSCLGLACGDASAPQALDEGCTALAACEDEDGPDGGPGRGRDGGSLQGQAGAEPDGGTRPVVPPPDTPVVSVEALAGALTEDAVVVVDARPAASFAQAHIAGARPLDAALVRAEVDGVPGQVAASDTLADVFGVAGLVPEEPIVVYGETSDLDAARLVWTLRHAGHPSVGFLDGGFEAFRAGDGDIERGGAAASATSYPRPRDDSDLRVDVTWMLTRLDDDRVQLVDARSQAEYDAGHIPGAVSLDWQGNVAGGALLSRGELEARHAGLDKGATVVAYCQTGSRAAMAWLVLTHLGFEDARLYDGSMAEWTQDLSRPIE